MPLGHTTRILAVVTALIAAAAVAAPAAAAAQPRAVVAFVPGATLEGLAALPGASAGLLSATQGRYRRAQALLDIGQGARTSPSAYDPREPPALTVGADGRVAGWAAAVRRARDATAVITPGLLAHAVPGGIAYAAPPGALGPAVAAAGEDGRIAALAHDGPAVPAALRLLRTHRAVFALLPGLPALRALLRERPPGTLVIALQAPPEDPATRVLPVATFGLGAGRALTSQTTHTGGIVAGIDIAPTLLERLGLPVPGAMTGQPLRLDGALDVAALRDTAARLDVVAGRRNPTFGFVAGGWLVLLAAGWALRGRAGARWAVRTGALGFLWVPAVLLVTAALAPPAVAEEAGVAAGALALGAVTGALVRWPGAPAVPGLVGAAAYVVDLAFGSPLIVRSLMGPNPIFGGRFYGIGNELEATLPVLALVGLAGALTLAGRGGRSPAAAVTFAAGGIVMGLAIGSGHLGADVGGVITVGAGFAAAVVLSLPGRVTRRRVLVAVLVPVAAVAVLAALDLATGGDAHFTRSVLRADGTRSLEDVVARRYGLAWDNLVHGAMPVLTALAVAAVAAAIVRRRTLLEGVPAEPVWAAALAGAAVAGVAGALANDSGPVLLVIAVFLAACTAAYLRAGRRPRVL